MGDDYEPVMHQMQAAQDALIRDLTRVQRMLQTAGISDSFAEGSSLDASNPDENEPPDKTNGQDVSKVYKLRAGLEHCRLSISDIKQRVKRDLEAKRAACAKSGQPLRVKQASGFTEELTLAQVHAALDEVERLSRAAEGQEVQVLRTENLSAATRIRALQTQLTRMSEATRHAEEELQRERKEREVLRAEHRQELSELVERHDNKVALLRRTISEGKDAAGLKLENAGLRQAVDELASALAASCRVEQALTEKVQRLTRALVIVRGVDDEIVTAKAPAASADGELPALISDGARDKLRKVEHAAKALQELPALKGAKADDQQATIDTLRRELEARNAQLTELEEEARQIKAQMPFSVSADASGDLSAQLRDDVERLEDERKMMGAQLSEKEAELRAAHEELADLRKRVAAAQSTTATDTVRRDLRTVTSQRDALKADLAAREAELKRAEDDVQDKLTLLQEKEGEAIASAAKIQELRSENRLLSEQLEKARAGAASAKLAATEQGTAASGEVARLRTQLESAIRDQSVASSAGDAATRKHERELREERERAQAMQDQLDDLGTSMTQCRQELDAVREEKSEVERQLAEALHKLENLKYQQALRDCEHEADVAVLRNDHDVALEKQRKKHAEKEATIAREGAEQRASLQREMEAVQDEQLKVYQEMLDCKRVNENLTNDNIQLTDRCTALTSERDAAARDAAAAVGERAALQQKMEVVEAANARLLASVATADARADEAASHVTELEQERNALQADVSTKAAALERARSEQEKAEAAMRLVQQSLQDLRKEKDSLQGELRSAQGKLAEEEAKQKKLRQELDKQRAEAGDLERALDSEQMLREEMSRKDTELTELREEYDEAMAELDRMRVVLERRPTETEGRMAEKAQEALALAADAAKENAVLKAKLAARDGKQGGGAGWGGDGEDLENQLRDMAETLNNITSERDQQATELEELHENLEALGAENASLKQTLISYREGGGPSLDRADDTPEQEEIARLKDELQMISDTANSLNEELSDVRGQLAEALANGGGGGGASDEEVERLHGEVTRLQQQNATLREDLRQATRGGDGRSALQGRLDAAVEELEASRKERASARQEADTYKAEKSALQRALFKAEQKLLEVGGTAAAPRDGATPEGTEPIDDTEAVDEDCTMKLLPEHKSIFYTLPSLVLFTFDNKGEEASTAINAVRRVASRAPYKGSDALKFFVADRHESGAQDICDRVAASVGLEPGPSRVCIMDGDTELLMPDGPITVESVARFCGQYVTSKNPDLVDDDVLPLLRPCPLALYGCEERGPLGEINAHIGVCPFSNVSCPLCITSVPASELTTHYVDAHNDDITAPRRCPLASYGCTARLPLGAVNTHLAQCHFFSVACLECHERVPRPELANHAQRVHLVANTISHVHSCPCRAAGCAYTTRNLGDLATHMRDCRHYVRAEPTEKRFSYADKASAFGLMPLPLACRIFPPEEINARIGAVKTFDMSGYSWLSDESVARLAEALRSNATVRNIVLMEHSFSKPAAEALASLLTEGGRIENAMVSGDKMACRDKSRAEWATLLAKYEEEVDEPLELPSGCLPTIALRSVLLPRSGLLPKVESPKVEPERPVLLHSRRSALP